MIEEYILYLYNAGTYIILCSVFYENNSKTIDLRVHTKSKIILYL